MSRFGNSTWAGSSSVFPPQQQSAPELALTAPTTATTNGSGSDADSSSFELAKKSINQCYQQDSSTVDSFPEFGRQGNEKSRVYTPKYSSAWQPFQLTRALAIPQDILSTFSTYVTPHTALGLLPAIDRAYTVIEDLLYIWDYLETQKDPLVTYTSTKGSTEKIEHVSVVPAKPGMFVDNIQHVLLVCRTSSIEILGLAITVTPGANGVLPKTELELYDTDIAVPTNNQSITSSVGLHNGRVMLCGGGGLFELVYDTKDRWFKRNAYLENHSGGAMSSLIPFGFRASNLGLNTLAHDPSRGMLYGLTDDVRILVYDVSSKCNPVGSIADIAVKAQQIAPGREVLNTRNFRIISIIPISKQESEDIRLVAVTDRGVRLYFSGVRPLASNTAGYTHGNTASSSLPLHLVHVRLPPDQLPNPVAGKPGAQAEYVVQEVGAVACKNGVTAMGRSLAKELGSQNVVLMIVPDLGHLTQQPSTSAPQIQSQGGLPLQSGPQPNILEFAELAELTEINGDIWDVVVNPSVPAVSTAAGWNELATQFSGPGLSFLALTNAYLGLVSRKKPVQTLCSLLDEYPRTHDFVPIEYFATSYGPVQTLTMMFAIAADNHYVRLDDQLYSPVAVDAVMMGSSFTPNPIHNNTRELAKSYIYQYGGKPTSAYATTKYTKYSPRFEALSLYFSRLVRPLWKEKVTSGPLEAQVLSISQAILMSVQRDLEHLKVFLANNPQMFLPGPTEYGNRGGLNSVDQEAYRDETAAATQLQTLLNQTIEAISFVLLLKDNNLPSTAAKMDPALQKALGALTYEALLTTKDGKDTARSLVNALVNQQITQQISVENISEVLQQRCGSFCSADDVMLYKAQEQIRRAKELPEGRERTAALENSLRLFERGTRNMSLPKLRAICQDYTELRFTFGLVLLPLKCAEDWDVDRRGEAYFNDGCPPDDPRAEALERRNACYQCIIDSFKNYDTTVGSLEANGQRTEAAEWDTTIHHAISIALRSQDFVFHSALYDYLMENERSELLEMESPFVERYLLHHPQTLVKADLLWQFYVRKGRNMEAAKALAELAESTVFGLTLEQRIEYLSRAIGNAKSTSSDGRRFGTEGEFLSDLEDKLDVATVQMELLVRASREVPEEDRNILLPLREQLLSISELYRDYADPLSLHDMKLLILHTSEHQDLALVTTIWTAIFDEYRDSEDRFAQLGAKVAELGRKFYPSAIAFPLDLLSEMLETESLQSGNVAPPGWALRVLTEGSVPHEEVLDYFERIRESGVPPYQDAVAAHHVLKDITAFIGDWLDECLRPGSRYAKAAFPAGKIEDLVDHYISSLRTAGDDPTRRKLMDILSKVRSRF